MTELVFQKFVADLHQQYPNQRVVAFEFEGKKYWLKQIESLNRKERIIKGNALKAFQREVKNLTLLNKAGVPVPNIVLSTAYYFVLEDVGQPLNRILANFDEQTRIQVLCQASRALAELHQKQIIHGRPALRDITYLNHQIYFIDFEAPLFSRNIAKQKMRDLFLLFHNLCKEELTFTELHQAMRAYRDNGGDAIYQQLLKLVQKTRWLYGFLNLFKSIAGGDLLAGLRLYQFLLGEKNEENHCDDNVSE